MKTLSKNIALVVIGCLFFQACMQEKDTSTSDLKREEVKELLVEYGLPTEPLDKVSSSDLDTVNIVRLEKNLKNWVALKTAFANRNLSKEDVDKLVRINTEIDSATSNTERKIIREKYADFFNRIK